MEWISVKDKRRPNLGDHVPVFWQGEIIYCVFQDDGFFYIIPSNIFQLSTFKYFPDLGDEINVDYFALLPEPPKE